MFFLTSGTSVLFEIPLDSQKVLLGILSKNPARIIFETFFRDSFKHIARDFRDFLKRCCCIEFFLWIFFQWYCNSWRNSSRNSFRDSSKNSCKDFLLWFSGNCIRYSSRIFFSPRILLKIIGRFQERISEGLCNEITDGGLLKESLKKLLITTLEIPRRHSLTFSGGIPGESS